MNFNATPEHNSQRQDDFRRLRPPLSLCSVLWMLIANWKVYSALDQRPQLDDVGIILLRGIEFKEGSGGRL